MHIMLYRGVECCTVGHSGTLELEVTGGRSYEAQCLMWCKLCLFLWSLVMWCGAGSGVVGG